MRIWRLIGGLGCLVFALPVFAAWTLGDIPLTIKWLSLAMLAITFYRPAWGLLGTAFLTPLTAYTQALFAPGVQKFAVTEMLLAPFLLSAGIRMAFGWPAPPGRLARPAIVVGVIVACGGIVGLAARQQVTDWPLEYVRAFGAHLFTSYFDESAAWAPYHLAITWIEALTLAVFAERLIRANHRAWPAVLIAAATVAAATSWIRLMQLASRSGWSAAIELVGTSRIQTLFNDANAAGSLFALYVVPAAWLAFEAAKQARKRRAAVAGYTVASIVIALALYMTISRAAYAGAVIGLAALWLCSRRPSRRTIAVVLGATATAITVLVALNPGSQSQSSPATSMDVRWQMGRIAAQMTRQHPVFGVGLGEFRRESRAFITEPLMATFPQTRVGENAHNNFLQILAELGLIGFVGYLWLLAAGLRPIAPGGASTAGSRALAGGGLALLVSSLGGHPFLTGETLWNFCLVLGAAAGLGAVPITAVQASAWPRRVVMAAVVFLLALLPIRLWQLRYADLRHNYIGAGRLMKDVDGTKYQLADVRSLWWIPGTWRVVEIPLRVTGESTPPCLVQIAIDGRPVNMVSVDSSVWTRTTIELTPAKSGRPSRPVELTVQRAECRLMAGEMTTRE